MFGITVLLLVLVTVFGGNADRMKCQMVPLQTSQGLVGMCCVFDKNVSASDLRDSVLEDGVVRFPDDKKNENAMPEMKDTGIVFPGRINHHHKKDHPAHNNTHAVEKGNNATMIHFPNAGNKNATNSTMDLPSRNKNDAPDTCTDGKKVDLDENCVEAF